MTDTETALLHALGMESPRRRRERLLIQGCVRLLLGTIYGVLLFVTGAPAWAFVLAVIAATYWGPVR